MENDWLSTTQVAELLGRTRQWVARMLDDPDHEYFPGAWRVPGGQWKIPRSGVDQFLETRKRAVSRVRRRKPVEQSDGAYPARDENEKL
jgi:excisionase family DNA binding protein